ncbi:MAG: hypothetical protein ACOYOA_15090, partial [Saprospiraceae bacterium]
MTTLILNPLADANSFRKKGQFTEAVALYDKHWSDNDIARNEWDAWSYAVCLRKTGRFKELLELCRSTYRLQPTFEAMNTLYAWAIYYTSVKNEKVSEAELLKAVKGIMQLCTQENEYSPYTLAVMKVLDKLSAKQKFPAAAIMEWIAKLDLDELDTNGSSFTDDKGKTIAIASRYEQVMSLLAKAQHMHGDHTACIATVEQT